MSEKESSCEYCASRDQDPFGLGYPSCCPNATKYHIIELKAQIKEREDEDETKTEER